MEITSWTKLAVVVIVCSAAVLLGFFDKLDSQAVVALLSASLGYVFGNAHGVVGAIAAQNAHIAQNSQSVQNSQSAHIAQNSQVNKGSNGQVSSGQIKEEK